MSRGGSLYFVRLITARSCNVSSCSGPRQRLTQQMIEDLAAHERLHATPVLAFHGPHGGVVGLFDFPTGWVRQQDVALVLSDVMLGPAIFWNLQRHWANLVEARAVWPPLPNVWRGYDESLLELHYHLLAVMHAHPQERYRFSSDIVCRPLLDSLNDPIIKIERAWLSSRHAFLVAFAESVRGPGAYIGRSGSDDIVGFLPARRMRAHPAHLVAEGRPSPLAGWVHVRLARLGRVP